MIGTLRSIVLGVSTAALFGGIAMTLVRNGALREIIRISVGIMLILSLLYPVSKICLHLPLKSFRQSTEAITHRVDEAKNQQKDLLVQSSSREIGAYLMRKAKNEGIVCDIDVFTQVHDDNTVSIEQIAVYADLTAQQRVWMEAMLEEECGILRENQIYVER